MPVISVIMGVYNAEETLSKALDSLLSQTFKDWELIICDDGSTDCSEQILEQYQKRHPEKIQIIHHEKNLGLGTSLNDCLKSAHGDFIARQDADDVSLSERFQKQLDYLQTHQNIDLVGTAIELYNSEGTYGIIPVVINPSAETLRSYVPFCHPTIVARREVFDRLGGYDTSIQARRCEDHELWFRFFEAGLKGDNLSEILYRYSYDIKTAKRRHIVDRWNGYLINLQGFHRLHFPWWVYCKETIKLLKIFIPRSFIYWYHKRKFATRELEK